MGYELRAPLNINPISNDIDNKRLRIIVIDKLIEFFKNDDNLFFVDESPLSVQLLKDKQWS